MGTVDTQQTATVTTEKLFKCREADYDKSFASKRGYQGKVRKHSGQKPTHKTYNRRFHYTTAS